MPTNLQASIEVERSPLGDQRERKVPCWQCHRPTANWSATCNGCRAEDRDADRFDELERHDGEDVA